jgi:transcriptional regulator with GAF, ATPase, and Fis domain
VMIQRHAIYTVSITSAPELSGANEFHGIIRLEGYARHLPFIERVALSDISVLICGESSTGKELVAHAIHRQSPRKNNPLLLSVAEPFRESVANSLDMRKCLHRRLHAKKQIELAIPAPCFWTKSGNWF